MVCGARGRSSLATPNRSRWLSTMRMAAYARSMEWSCAAPRLYQGAHKPENNPSSASAFPNLAGGWPSFSADQVPAVICRHHQTIHTRCPGGATLRETIAWIPSILTQTKGVTSSTQQLRKKIGYPKSQSLNLVPDHWSGLEWTGVVLEWTGVDWQVCPNLRGVCLPRGTPSPSASSLAGISPRPGRCK